MNFMDLLALTPCGNAAMREMGFNFMRDMTDDLWPAFNGGLYHWAD